MVNTLLYHTTLRYCVSDTSWCYLHAARQCLSGPLERAESGFVPAVTVVCVLGETSCCVGTQQCFQHAVSN
jgi:hypothetical protein